ncbi:MAG: hypothetical protein KGL39_33005 [Patescibacteria group bacterium]|nr:hypothetical protein [Patescibacteria group bacterium]
MDEIHEFVDERQGTCCLHCARQLADVKRSRDHVPTKTLLHPPYPPNLPIVVLCHECNQGFSPDEQYLVAFLSAVLAGSSEPDAQVNPNARRILRYNRVLQADIEAARNDDEGTPLWRSDQGRIRRVIVKNARGHAFFEYGELMLCDPALVSFVPLPVMKSEDRARVEDIPSTGLWPEVGSRMMKRVMTGQDLDGPWVVVQDGIYRYGVTLIDGGLLVRSVLHEYLATEVLWE